MDIIKKNWKHHASTGLAAVALGLVEEKVLGKKTIIAGSLNTAVLSFVTVTSASMIAEYVMDTLEKK